MSLIDRGHGAPIVLIPGIQGRWEYLRPAIDALSQSFRVISFPLCGERGSGCQFDPAAGFGNFVNQIDAVLDDRGLSRATIAGISFGGLIALHYAAERPSRTSALILTSTPPPHFHLSRRHTLYTRAPRLFGVAFLAETPRRLRDELRAALPDRRERLRFMWGQVRTFAVAPLSLPKIAQRARLLATAALMGDCSRATAPTLIVTGERRLDRVVPVDGSMEYLQLIRASRAAQIDRTGHVGSITRPDAFVNIVTEFLRTTESAHDGQSRSTGDPHAA